MTGRNEPCPCGSGKKFKKCCASKAVDAQQGQPQVDPGLVINYMNNGQWSVAIDAIHNMLKLDANNPDLVEMLAVAYYQSGQLQLAAENFLQQTRLSKGNAQAHNNLAQVLFELGHNEDASLHCQQALKLDKQLDSAHNCMGNIYRAAKRLKDAHDSYQQAISLNSENPLYFCNLGTVQTELGQYEEAEKSLSQAISLSPEFVDAINNYAAVLQKQNKLEQAIENYHRALSLDENNLEILNNLGSCYLEQQDSDKANEIFNKIVSIDPNFPDVYVSMAQIAEDNNNIDEAIALYQKSLELSPGNENAYYGLGTIYLELGNYFGAVESFNKALKSNPNFALAFAGLANAFIKANKTILAREYLEKAIELNPDNAFVHLINAKLHASMDEPREALKEFQYVLKVVKDDFLARSELADFYLSGGKYEQAEEQYQILAENDKPEIYLTWAAMEEHRHNLDKAESLIKKYEKITGDVESTRALSAKLFFRRKKYQEAINVVNQIDLENEKNISVKVSALFEKGRSLDKLGKYTEAFNCFFQANTFKKDMVGFDVEDSLEEYERYKEIFSKLDNPFNPATESFPKPVFIVGFMRSGTTLLEQIISSHPDVVAGDELVYISQLAANKANELMNASVDYPESLLKATPAELNLLRQHYLDRAFEDGVIDSDTLFFTDKMPLNLTQLGLINLLFPGSPVIHIIRHPLDSCFSSYISNFKRMNLTTDIEATAIKYKQVMDLAEFYKNNLDMKYMEVHYEDLVDNQEEWSRKIIDFIGLDWDDACLDFHKSKRVARTASYEQVTQKIYTSSRFRYKNYYEQLKPIFPILKETIERFGYTIEP